MPLDFRNAAKASIPRSWPVAVNVSELTGLCGWPLGSQVYPGVDRSGARLLPVAESVARRGRVVAVSTFPAFRDRIARTRASIPLLQSRQWISSLHHEYRGTRSCGEQWRNARRRNHRLLVCCADRVGYATVVPLLQCCPRRSFLHHQSGGTPERHSAARLQGRRNHRLGAYRGRGRFHPGRRGAAPVSGRLLRRLLDWVRRPQRSDE